MLSRRDVRLGLSAAVALATLAIALDLKAGRSGKGSDEEQGWESAATAVALVALVTALATMAIAVPYAFDAKYGDGPDKGSLQMAKVRSCAGGWAVG